MLKPLLGSDSKERILVFLYCRDEGYGAEMAQFYQTDLTPLQQQLRKLEEGGVLVSFRRGRTLLYMFNPCYPFLAPLKALLEKSMEFRTPEERERLTKNRRRPRRSQKPL